MRWRRLSRFAAGIQEARRTDSCAQTTIPPLWRTWGLISTSKRKVSPECPCGAKQGGHGIHLDIDFSICLDALHTA